MVLGGSLNWKKVLNDMLIMDVYMSHMDGIEFLNKIDRKNSDLLILAMTGLPSKEVNEKVIENGAYVCLIKPFPLNLLITSIEQCVEHSGVQKSLSEPVSNKSISLYYKR